MRIFSPGFFALLAAYAALGSANERQAAGPTGSDHDTSSVELPTEPGQYAIIYTSSGTIVCRLFDKSAPKTVANFVGLATGTKAWTDPETGKTKHTPIYPGTTFHRVIPGFMIQGGDPLGDGRGTPGYQIDDEIDSSLGFDKPGILAMANSGPNTNGSQFFITVAPAPHLDGRYSIFGEVVSGQSVVDSISQAPRDDEDKPLTAVKILRIAIRRVAPGQSNGSTKAANPAAPK